MAKKVEMNVTLTDDIDGAKAVRTIAFAFDGMSYEIDLSKKNAAAFEKVLSPYVGAARRTTRKRAGTPSTGRGRGRRDDLGAIRDWAKTNGYSVSDRGRIPQAIQDAYDAEH